MSDLVDLTDAGQLWGADLRLSPTGDLAMVSGADRSKERVLRRLLTNPGDYLFSMPYGGGVPAQIGEIADNAKITGNIQGQMKIEPSVSQAVAPTVVVAETDKGVAVSISYIAAPDQTPAALSFTVSP